MEDDLRREHARQSTPQTAVTELQYVVPKLGASLQAVEIGNELNLYNVVERPEHLAFVRAGHPQQLREHAVAGPGIFEDINYATNFINGEASIIDLVDASLLPGPSRDLRRPRLANLMNLDPASPAGRRRWRAGADQQDPGRVPLGRDEHLLEPRPEGISDALVSALWGINFMLSTAGYGSVGVNFHGGGQNMDGNVCPTGVDSCDRPFRYSPLIEVDSRVTAAAPLFYGMLLVSRIGTGDMLRPRTIAGSTNSGHTPSPPADGSTAVVLVNGEASTGVNATVDIGAPVSSATAIYLRGRVADGDDRRHLGRGAGQPGRSLEPQGALHA